MGPVFIAGCGRSGTSLLRTVLDAHPDIFIPGESLFLVDYLRHAPVNPPGFVRRLFFSEPQLKCWYNGPAFAFSRTAEAIAQVHETMASARQATIWGQKTPRFVRHISLLRDVFPDSRWLLIYRDPRAVVASMLQSKQHTASVHLAVKRWLRDNRPILDLMAAEPRPEWVQFVKYEDFILAYDAMLEAIFGFLGVEPKTADYIEAHAEPVFFPRSRFRINTVREGVRPDPNKMNTWDQVLSDRDVTYIESQCREPMQRFGYEPRTATAAPAGVPLEYRLAALKDAGIVYRYATRWPEYLIHTALRMPVLRLHGLLR